MLAAARAGNARHLARIGLLLPHLCHGLSAAASPSSVAANKCEVAGKATWRLIEPAHKPIARSSHGISFNPADGYTYCWGGEHTARHPIDSNGVPLRTIYSQPLDVVLRAVWRLKQGDWGVVETTGNAPEPRVAHSQAITDGGLYIWGGRQVSNLVGYVIVLIVRCLDCCHL